jgi:hypothetical protein
MGIQVPFWAPQPPISCRKNGTTYSMALGYAPALTFQVERVNCLSGDRPAEAGEMISAVGAISKRRTAYTSSQDLRVALQRASTGIYRRPTPLVYQHQSRSQLPNVRFEMRIIEPRS